MASFNSFIDAVLAPRRILQYACAYVSLSAPIVRAGTLQNLIVDTDLFSDVDDAAALLLASTLPATNLLAVNVNVNSTYTAIAASGILNHYGHPNVPIGLRRPYANTSFFDSRTFEFGEYASKVAYRWSGGSIPFFQPEKAWDPVELYRKTLAEAADGSITIASVGFFENLSGLLNSTADVYSKLDGYKLVEAKVKEFAVMGGAYPSGHEFNFFGDSPLHTAHVVNTWPETVPITFLGYEVGVEVSTGARLTTLGPANDPAKAAYQYYVGYNTTRFSWDPLTVVYAVEGLRNWFEYGNIGGYNYVFPNGSNIWKEDETKTNQHYLKLKISNETIAKELDDIYLKGAVEFGR